MYLKIADVLILGECYYGPPKDPFREFKGHHMPRPKPRLDVPLEFVRARSRASKFVVILIQSILLDLPVLWQLYFSRRPVVWFRSAFRQNHRLLAHGTREQGSLRIHEQICCTHTGFGSNVATSKHEFRANPGKKKACRGSYCQLQLAGRPVA